MSRVPAPFVALAPGAGPTATAAPPWSPAHTLARIESPALVAATATARAPAPTMAQEHERPPPEQRASPAPALGEPSPRPSPVNVRSSDPAADPPRAAVTSTRPSLAARSPRAEAAPHIPEPVAPRGPASAEAVVSPPPSLTPLQAVHAALRWVSAGPQAPDPPGAAAPRLQAVTTPGEVGLAALESTTPRRMPGGPVRQATVASPPRATASTPPELLPRDDEQAADVPAPPLRTPTEPPVHGAHIGTVEIHIEAAPATQPPPAAPPAPSRAMPSAPLARGYSSPVGLRQS